jgi:hypothetical protein
MEKLELSYIVGGLKNGVADLENILAVPQKVKYRATVCLIQSTLRYIPSELKTYEFL